MKKKISKLSKKITYVKQQLNDVKKRFYKNKPVLAGQGKYKQGIYKPNFPDKYKGRLDNLVFRSGLELKWFKFFDLSPNILQWKCEEVIINYISPLDNCKHKYFIDVFILYKTNKGVLKKALIEIKPLDQTKPPEQPKRITKGYAYAVKQYILNEAKWNAASKIAEVNNIEFKILTEQGFVSWNPTY